MRRIALLLLVAFGHAAVAQAAPPSALQSAAVSGGHGWLNTSRPLTAEDLQGRIVLLDFWTLGCINCMDIIPDLKALEAEFGDRLTVVGVHSAKFADEKQSDSIRSAVLRYGLTHPVENDSDFTVWNKFGVRAWPTLVLLSPDGQVANTYSGEGNKAAIEADIRTLIHDYKAMLVTAPLPIALESGKEAKTELRFPGKAIAADEWGAHLKTYPWLYIADSGHNRIVAAELSGTISDIAGAGTAGFKDGDFKQAQFFKPQGMACQNGRLYVADLGNHALRFADGMARTVTTLAGTGKQGRYLTDMNPHDALSTPLSSPWDVAFWPDDHHLAIAMAGAHQIWSYDIDRHTVSLLAGNGSEALQDGAYPQNALAQPSSLFAAGDKLYFTDAESSSLRLLDKSGNVTTLVGKGLFDFGYHDGDREEARLQHPLGLTGNADSLYIADTYNHSIRVYNLKTGMLHDYGGHNARGAADGLVADASFNEPGGIALFGSTLYVADTNNNAIRTIDMAKGTVGTLNVHPPTPPSVAEDFSRKLPNQQTLTFHVAHDVPIRVSLALAHGWHINAEAPSELDDYIEADTPMRNARFTRDVLRGGPVTLPAFNTVHRLRGTLYYCPDKAGSQCDIKSLDVTLTPDGKDTQITLPVN